MLTIDGKEYTNVSFLFELNGVFEDYAAWQELIMGDNAEFVYKWAQKCVLPSNQALLKRTNELLCSPDEEKQVHLLIEETDVDIRAQVICGAWTMDELMDLKLAFARVMHGLISIDMMDEMSLGNKRAKTVDESIVRHKLVIE